MRNPDTFTSRSPQPTPSVINTRTGEVHLAPGGTVEIEESIVKVGDNEILVRDAIVQPDGFGTVVYIHRSKPQHSGLRDRINAVRKLPESREDGNRLGLKTRLRLVFAKSGTIGIDKNSKAASICLD